MGVVRRNSVEFVTSVTNVKKKQNKQQQLTLSGSGSSSYAVEYSQTLAISRKPTICFVASLPF